MDVFPAFFPLAGGRVVIAGGGDAAEARARLFDGAPAVIERVRGEAAFRSGAYEGGLLAFVADPDREFRRAAAAAARMAHVPVNVADDPELSDFHVPAVIDRGQVVIGLGTGGASPMLAAVLRADLEAHVPPGMGAVARVLGEHRSEIRAAFPDLARRRNFLRAMIEGDVARAALGGDLVAAVDHLRRAIMQGGETAGKVTFIEGADMPERVSLAALRALAAADVVVIDGAAEGLIAGYARRDADRLAGDSAAPEAIARGAAGGRRVAILVAGAEPARVDDLRRRGVVVEVLPCAPGP